ncbi:MAG TPA: SAM-dependent chlorinase/fluorinase [Stellaceae bacterium]|jgi:hypothetical protein|nr:SAM-dependent chlorinase/fluorinase [Stellaceae bacterium]
MIVLFTDFGLSGPYTGQMQAVLQQQAPGEPVVSLFADAPIGQPRPSAYLLAAYAAWFPPATIFLCVVDPEVGSDRRALIVEAEAHTYVGPDNGLFELVMRRASTPRCWQITWQPPALSPSFHGRDLFAPIAARVARGVHRTELAHEIAVPPRRRDWPDDLSEIVYIDHYGNAMTGLRGSQMPKFANIRAGGQIIPRANTFSEVPDGETLWYVNANGLVELAVNGGRADQVLDLTVGGKIEVFA